MTFFWAMDNESLTKQNAIDFAWDDYFCPFRDLCALYTLNSSCGGKITFLNLSDLPVSAHLRVFLSHNLMLQF